jgi:aminotransferase
MGIPVDPDRHIAVTCGSTEAMMAAMMSVVNPGDEVVVFSPFYENYGADAILSGATPIYVPLEPPEFSFRKETLRAAFQRRPKALILCNPSNPTGKDFTREELEYIAALAEEFDAWVITDEVYEHIVYEPASTSISPPSRDGGRTISCSSLSKTYSITGWRLGYTIAPPAATDVSRKVHDFLTVGAAAPLQEAATAALSLPDSYYADLLASYTRKRDVFLAELDAAGLKYVKPEGAYYVLVDASEFDGSDDTRFCEWMAREVGVAAVPGSSFFREPVRNLVRFHFAKRERPSWRGRKTQTCGGSGGSGATDHIPSHPTMGRRRSISPRRDHQVQVEAPGISLQRSSIFVRRTSRISRERRRLYLLRCVTTRNGRPPTSLLTSRQRSASISRMWSSTIIEVAWRCMNAFGNAAAMRASTGFT